MSRAADLSRLRLIVSGRVQGVFFRAGAAHTARALGLRGWARNRADGTVEIVAEGTRGALERLLEWAKIGPPRARVDHVDADWSAAAGEFSAFEVR
jgi:acylphosphatase